jgi:SAM-dependent methyltransferase
MVGLAPVEYQRDYYVDTLSKAKLFPREYDFYRSFLGLHIKGESVLNVGCGPLYYEDLMYLSYSPKRYVGIDINASAFKYMSEADHPRLNECKKYVETNNIQTEFLAESIFDWAATTNERFDSIFGIGVFATFYGEKFDQLMEALWRVLKKGGHLVNVSWDGNYYTEKIAKEKVEYQFGQPGPGFTPDEVVQQIVKGGFRLRERRILMTDDPADYKWDSIHISAYKKG